MRGRALKRSILLIAALTLLAPFAFASSEDPATARGFNPESLYQFGNLDNINLFNGNLIVTLPIGQAYAVNSKFGPQLTLSYNSSTWDLTTRAYGRPGFCNGPEGYFYIPNRKSNTGMGWSLGFGRLFPPCHPANEGQDIVFLTYESPDGASHAFTYSTDNGNTLYTSDNSHLRIRNYNSSVVQLDFPDGSTYSFLKDGCNEWPLLSMTDASGNTVGVSWDTNHYTQTITDPFGRQTIIYYANAQPNDVYDRVVSAVDMPAFTPEGSNAQYSRATYYFSYTYPRLDVPVFNAPCGYYTFVVPQLTQITRPDGSAFNFEYGYSGVNASHTGTLLVQMTLPTKGKIQWDYSAWEIPGPTCQPVVPWPTSVTKRKFYDPFANTTETWEYTSEVDPGPFDNDPYYCWPNYDNQYLQVPKEQKRTIVKSPRGDKTVHYFSIFKGRGQDGSSTPLSPNGYDAVDFGLSMSKLVPAVDGAFLTSRQYDCGGTGNCDDSQPDRSTYMLYEHHKPANVVTASEEPFNVLPKKTRTVFEKDLVGGTKAYVDVSSSDYDGYGHYRVVTTSGNFGANGAVQSRTVTTNFNGVDYEVGNPATHSDIKGGSGTWGVNFAPYPSTEKWILNTFTSVTMAEGGASSKQLFLFDRYTGFLKRTRLRRGVLSVDRYTDSGNTVNDLLTVFEPTTIIGGLQAAGDIAAETHYGGDRNPLTDTTTALADLNLGSAPYGMRTETTYRYGSAATAAIVSAPYGTLNISVDKNTGFPFTSTDPAGHVTKFEFDKMARISKQVLPSGAQTDYTYPITDHARAIATTHALNSSTTLLKSTYTFDAFGRVASIRDLMSDGNERERTTTWNAMAQKTTETAPAVVGSTGAVTTYQYDGFNRPLTITPPDGDRHAITYSYAGTRSMSVTYGKPVGSWGGIGVSLDFYGDVVEQPAVVATQEFDSFSRLSKVTEYGQSGNTTSSYTYDSGGRMKSATTAAAEGSQTRSFVYDNRGFLVSQTQPETGTTTFSNYDAFGHAGRRILGNAGGAFDLTYAYDIYQRLTEIYQGGTLLKKITFDTLPYGDAEGSYSEPTQIVKTYRRNYHAELGGDVGVTTYLKYDTAGRLSDKKTIVGNSPAFSQHYNYDTLDNVSSLDYPSCTGCTPLSAGASIPNRTISFRWSNGYLTGVDEGANRFTSATWDKLITYWPNGVMKSVTHVAKDNTHETTDSQTLESGMSRIGTITFNGVSAPTCTPPNATITAPGTIQAGTSATASVPATTGATYAWTIQNGTITSGQGSNVITFSSFCGTGNVILGVTVSTSTSCSASSSKTVATTGGSSATASVTGSQTITSGGAAQIWVTLTGTAPWNVTWNDGTVMSNIQYSQIPRWVTPTSNTSYYVTSVTDAYGCGTASGQAIITVSGYCTPSDPTMTAPSSVAAGGTFTVTFNPPPTGGGSSFSIQNGTLISSTATSATVRAGCSGNVVLNFSISASPNTCASSSTKNVAIIRSSAVVSGSQTINSGNGAPIYATLSGTAPWTVTWSDGFTQSNVTWSPLSRTVYPTTTTTYTVTSFSDGNGCSGNTSGSATVTVNSCGTLDTTITAPSSVNAGSTFTAYCNLPSGGSCSWSAQNAALLSTTANSATFSASCSASPAVSLTVSQGACSSPPSSKTITIVKSNAVVSGSATINQGGSATISAALSGSAPWTLTWSDGFVQSNVTSSPAQRSVFPASTTTYTVTSLSDLNGCAGTTSGAAVVSVNVPAPTNLSATAVSTTQVNISWLFSGSADQFNLYRNGVIIYGGAATSFVDTGVSPSNAYWYKVVAIKGGTSSPESNRDIATTVIFADDPIVPTVTLISAQHINQLRTAVNAVRVTSGLAPATFTDTITTGLDVRAQHITELRVILDDARARLLLPAIVYERPAITIGAEIRARDITDLRGGVK